MDLKGDPIDSSFSDIRENVDQAVFSNRGVLTAQTDGQKQTLWTLNFLKQRGDTLLHIDGATFLEVLTFDHYVELNLEVNGTAVSAVPLSVANRGAVRSTNLNHRLSYVYSGAAAGAVAITITATSRTRGVGTVDYHYGGNVDTALTGASTSSIVAKEFYSVSATTAFSGVPTLQQVYNAGPATLDTATSGLSITSHSATGAFSFLKNESGPIITLDPAGSGTITLPGTLNPTTLDVGACTITGEPTIDSTWPAAKRLKTATGAVTIDGAVQPTSGQVLTADGTGLLATWETPSAAGVTDLQSAYDGGATIATTANVPVLITHTMTSADDIALEVDVTDAGYSGGKALDIVYTTTAGAGEEEDAILVNIDRHATFAGNISALRVGATEGAGAVRALEVGPEVKPVTQLSGTFGLPSEATIDINGTATAHAALGAFFVAQNDYIILSHNLAYESIEFLLSTGATGPGVAPTFEYQTTGPVWTAFGPADGTNAFRNTGTVTWLSTDVPGQVSDGGLYKIRITRTRIPGTGPTSEASGMKVAVVNEYGWDETGDILANSVDVGTISIGGVAVTSTSAELNLVDGALPATTVNNKAVVYGATGEMSANGGIHLGPTGVLDGGATIVVPGVDYPSLPVQLGIGTASLVEIGRAGITTRVYGTLEPFGAFSLGGTSVTATGAELNILDGVTSTTAELNILDGVTSTAAELNILDGVTSTAAELNILDGVTSTAAELNILDGVTASTTELNYLDIGTQTVGHVLAIQAGGTTAAWEAQSGGGGGTTIYSAHFGGDAASTTTKEYFAYGGGAALSTNVDAGPKEAWSWTAPITGNIKRVVWSSQNSSNSKDWTVENVTQATSYAYIGSGTASYRGVDSTINLAVTQGDAIAVFKPSTTTAWGETGFDLYLS